MVIVEKWNVICDAVNIEYNNNYIRGYCLNCDNDTTVYKCPKCGQFINAELFDKTKCHEGFCSVFEWFSIREEVVKWDHEKGIWGKLLLEWKKNDFRL